MDPTGDITAPPPPPRDGATPDERMCAAAANAARVLEQVYEAASDAVQHGEGQAEVIAAMIAAIIGAIGSVFGIVVAPLITIIALLLAAFLDILNFVTADLWDDNFTKAMTCILLNCATEDGDVVHFDMQCVLQQLANQTNVFDLSTSQLRLFGQVAFILNIIGSQGLDAAGATTSVADPDCDDCEAVWCRDLDFIVGDNGFAAVADPVNGGTVGSYVPGQGFATRYYPASGDDVSLQTALMWDEVFVTCIRLTVNLAEWYGSPAGIYIREPEYEGAILDAIGFINEAGLNTYTLNFNDLNAGMNFQLYNFGAMTSYLTRVQIWGTGDEPTFGVHSDDVPPC